jgi:integrase/recombinase XerD
VGALLDATERCQRHASRIESRTLRMILLMVYAMGATVDEVLTLKGWHVDLEKSRIRLGMRSSKEGRTLPIGADFKKALAVYLRSTRRDRSGDDFVFRGADGRAINRNNLWERFRRLHAIAGVNQKPDGRRPRLQDLRYTFATHRLAQAIRQDANVNELVPALSTYMGYSSLTKAEQFLAYAPERFRLDLGKLSPAKSRKHWRENVELLQDLATL